MVLVAWRVLGLLAPGRMNTQARRKRDSMRRLSSTSAAAHVIGSAPARTGVGRVRPPRRGRRARTRPVECKLSVSWEAIVLLVDRAASPLVGYPQLERDGPSARTARPSLRPLGT